MAPRGLSFVRVASERSVLFIDGNNWYHGLKRIGVDAYDLDYAEVAKKLLKGRTLAEIRFYIGRVRGDRGRAGRQQRQLDRLERQGVRLFLGRIQQNPVPPDKNPALVELRQVLAQASPDTPTAFRRRLEELCRKSFVSYVEKQADVWIAVDLVSMAYRDEYDVAYLLSADADYVSAVREVGGIGKKVFPVRSWGVRSAELDKVVKAIPLKREWFDQLLIGSS